MDRMRNGLVRAVSRSVVVATVSILIVVALAAPAGAHDDGTTLHLWKDHIKPIGVPGTINTGTNPVDWTKLKGVPAAFADGTDDGVEGAGFGISKFGGAFHVDTSEVQDRVTGDCGPGRSIKSIAQDGTVACNAGPRGFTKTIADTGIICNGFCTQGSLALEAGTWAITAKIVVDQGDGDEDYLNVECQLHAGGLVDVARFRGVVNFLGGATLPMQLIATYDRAANASINCRDYDVGSAEGFNLSIIAIRLGT